MIIFANLNVKNFFLVMLICPVIFSQAQQKLPDNLSLLSGLTADVVDSVLQAMPLGAAEIVSIKSSNEDDPCNWIVENEFVKRLKSQGNDVLIGDVAEQSIDHLIEFRIIQFDVSYSSTSLKNLLARILAISLDVRITLGHDKKVGLFKNFSTNFIDSLATADVPRVELERYPFTQAKIHDSSSLTNYLEPFLVLVTTSGIIYLFFALRSK